MSSIIRARAVSLLLVAAALLWPAAQVGRAEGLSDISTSAWQLAAEGRIERLIDTIQSLPEQDRRRPAVQALREQIDTHRSLEATRRTQTGQAYRQTLAKLNEQIEAGQVYKALSRAVDAHGLAPDPDAFLKEGLVSDLVRKAELAAAEAEAGSDWFEALAVYRRLSLLFENTQTYKDQLRRVGRKLRILRLYSPDHYYGLADRYAKSQGEDPPQRWEGDDEQGWEQELADINRKMLLNALTRAADKHVESSSYQKLLLGGLDALEVMLDLKALRDTFAGLRDAEKVAAFEKFLDDTRQAIRNSENWIGYTQASLHLEKLIEKNRHTIKLPEEVLIYEFSDGAMSTLDDFTSIIWPTDVQRFERTTKQEFSGVGIQITLSDGELTVVSPLEGTPAHAARLKAGDRIVTIDGKATTGISLEQAVRAITGPEDTAVVLGVRGAGSDKVRDVKLTRKTIKIYSVKGFQRKPGGEWDYFIDPHQRIGYIRLSQFGPDTAVEMDEAIERMRKDGELNGLVLDLRFNPGGLLRAAVDVSNRFLDDGVIVSGHAGPNGGDAWSAKADRKSTYCNFPVVVLINKGSASASEIVSGALQDQDRALVLGENSYGKGSVQQLFPLQNQGLFGKHKAYIKVTTQYYKLPSGRIIHRRPNATTWGVKPDVEVRMTELQVEKLLKARMVIDVLRNEDEQVDPESVVGHEDSDDPDRLQLDDQPLPRSAREILERGYDPQLETAVLLLRARLIGELAKG